MTDRELFKQALDALDIAHRRHGFVDITVMTSLHSRLAQPQRKPLTKAAIEQIADSTPVDTVNVYESEPTWHQRFARAIEAAHGITGEDA